MIAAEGFSEGSAERVLSTSESNNGDPVTTVRPGRGLWLLVERTRVVAV
jgi:hypothetical protein